MLVLINLDSALKRRAKMTRQLDSQSLEFTRIGLDFRRLERPAVEREVRHRFPSLHFDLRRLSGAEIGCWASHLAAWQMVLDTGAPSLCVLEDDLVLAPGFAAAVCALQADPQLDLIYLGTSSRNISQRRQLQVGGLAVHAPIGLILNSWGYVVRRDWVRDVFATGGAIDMPIDHFIGGRARWSRPEIGVLQPAVVSDDPQLSHASQIGPYTARLDRASIVQQLRRAILDSRLSDLYYRTVYRML